MINVNSIMHELFVLVSSNTMFISSDFTIQKGVPINTDPNEAPWIGILRGIKQFEGHLIGGVQPWRGFLDMSIYHQEYSELPESDTWYILETVEYEILSLVTFVGNLNLNSTVEILNSVTSEPVFFDENVDQRFLTNRITCSYRVKL